MISACERCCCSAPSYWGLCCFGREVFFWGFLDWSSSLWWWGFFCLFFFSPLLWHFSQLIHRPRSSPASVLFTFVVGSRCVLRSCRQIVLARTSCVYRWGTAGAQRSLPSQKPLGLCCLRSRPELSVCEGISACSPCFARVTVPAPCLLSKERARPPSAGGQMSEGIAM